MKNADVMKYIGMSDNNAVFEKFGIYLLPSGAATVGKDKYPSLLEALKDVLPPSEYTTYGLDQLSDRAVRQEMQETMRFFKHKRLPTTTALEVPGKQISEIIDVVGSEVVYGHNFFKEIATGVRDLVGGHSVSIQKTLAESRKEALLELKEAAGELGADAIIAVGFTYTNIGGANGVSPLVAATGTAVKLAS